MAQAIGRFETRPSRPNRGVIAIGRASRSADGYEDLALRLLSAQRFFISSDNRYGASAVPGSGLPRTGGEVAFLEQVDGLVQPIPFLF
jgi:hypothetical protein